MLPKTTYLLTILWATSSLPDILILFAVSIDSIDHQTYSPVSTVNSIEHYYEHTCHF